MNNKLILFACGLILVSCQKKAETQQTTLQDCPVIARQVIENGDTITVCDLSLVKDTFDISLTSLFSSLEIVYLENTDEAIASREGSGAAAASENYLGMTSEGVYKLYTKEGKYLGNISSRGQGPDEYLSLYDSYIDEKNNRIYLLEYAATKLLVFDLEGKPQKHIPLSYQTHKGRFIVDAEKETVFMTALPFIDTPSATWLQDFQGNIIREYPSTKFIIDPGDYSNEVNFSFNTPELDYSMFHAAPAIIRDTLYHYDLQANRMKPVFTVNFKEYVLHSYMELSGYYLVQFYKMHMPGENHISPTIIIDKKTLRGCYANFRLRELGNINTAFYSDITFNRGYYINNIYPHELKEELKKALLRKDKLTPAMYQKVKALHDKIGEDDNNIILVGKLK